MPNIIRLSTAAWSDGANCGRRLAKKTAILGLLRSLSSPRLSAVQRVGGIDLVPDALDAADPVGGEPSAGAVHERDGGDGLLVRQGLGVGQAGDCRCAALTLLGARRRRRGSGGCGEIDEGVVVEQRAQHDGVPIGMGALATLAGLATLLMVTAQDCGGGDVGGIPHAAWPKTGDVGRRPAAAEHRHRFGEAVTSTNRPIMRGSTE